MLSRLQARGLTIDEVSRALQQQNLEVPGGRLDQGSRELVVRTLGRMRDVRDFNNLIVANFGGQPVYLKDIATVTDSVEEPRSLSRLNGNNSVTLVVRKQSGSNTVKLIESVKQRLEALKQILPPDFQLTVIRDQSIFINRSLDEISIHLVLGAVLVALTVFLFLHDWRGTVIASMAIPASLIATFTLMRAMGYTLNNFTMLGMVFAVGIVIDDAIVVLENIHRTMEETELERYARGELCHAGNRPGGDGHHALAGGHLSASGVHAGPHRPCSSPATASRSPSRSWFRCSSPSRSRRCSPRAFCATPTTNAAREEGPRRPAHALDGRPLPDRPALEPRPPLGDRARVSLACLASLVFFFKLTNFNFMPQDDSSEFEVAFQTPEGSTLERTATGCRARSRNG